MEDQPLLDINEPDRTGAIVREMAVLGGDHDVKLDVAVVNGVGFYCENEPALFEAGWANWKPSTLI